MSMKVFIAQREYDYEGFVVIGVFDSIEEAEKCCEVDKVNNESFGDSWSVDVFDLNERVLA